MEIRSLLFYKDDFEQALVKDSEFGAIDYYLGIQDLKTLSKRL